MNRSIVTHPLVTSGLSALGGIVLGAVASPVLLRLWSGRPARLVADVGSPGHRTVLSTGRRNDLERIRERVSPAFGRVWIESGRRRPPG